MINLFKRKKTYKEIEFGFGNINSAIKELDVYKQKGELVCGVFNGIKLYSDVDDLDSAFKKITGMTRAEHFKVEQDHHEKYLADEKKHKDAIPELTKEWIEKGKAVLDEKYIEEWNEVVPVSLDGLYHGMELGACLAIVKELNAGCDFSVAKDLINSQGHSGMSHGLVCSMVKAFCDRGTGFVNYVR